VSARSPSGPLVCRERGHRHIQRTERLRHVRLNFRDERYFPFEYQGAVSHWRIELPPENNYFDMTTLGDVLVNLNYKAREGGGVLRHEAMEAARKHLPGEGWCFFDVRHEFPDAWQMVRNSYRQKECEARLGLRMERRMFPFIPQSDEVSITKIAVLFHARGHDCDCPKTGDCPCRCGRAADCRVVEFTCGDHRRDDEPTRVSCVRSDEWADLYYGVFETEIGPIGKHARRQEIELRFPHETGDVETVCLLCQYERETTCR
jgi:Tc toxin complex TcA C-terminal TcB-binding domain